MLLRALRPRLHLFHRGVNLNAWLLQNGYLALQHGATGESGEYLQDIDWSRTRAYTFGLAGMYLNQKGREAQGIVDPGAEAAALKREIAAKLSGLARRSSATASRSAKPGLASPCTGPLPRRRAGPDRRLHRRLSRSWDAAVGKVTGQRFQ